MNPEAVEQCEREVIKTREVKRLKDKFLDKFFEDKDAQLFAMFKETPLGAADALNAIHHQLKSLNALRAEVSSVMDTGRMAGIMLDKT